MDRQTDRQTYGWTDRQIDRRTNRQTDGQTHRWTDRRTDKQTDRWMNGGNSWCMSVVMMCFVLLDVSGAAHMIGDIVTGVKPALAEGRPMEPMADDRDGAGRYQFLSEVLRWRAQTTPDHVLFTLLNEKVCVCVHVCGCLLSVRLSVCFLSVSCLSICLSVVPSVSCLSVFCLSVCLSVCLSFCFVYMCMCVLTTINYACS